MSRKRITIYDLAKALNISASYVSRALNNDPFINEKVKEQVKAKAEELNYQQNANAFNLRKGITRTIGVVVPKINEIFFANAIAGIEEACSKNNYNLIICQSAESLKKEIKAVETLIQQNVDCIIISVTMETDSSEHLRRVIENKMHLIQFDRVRNDVDSFKVENDNLQAAYIAVQHLIQQGYKKIAHIGGPGFLKVFNDRKQGYMKAMQEAGLKIPSTYMTEGDLTKTTGHSAATALLSKSNHPDAFFCSSDNIAFGVLQAAAAMKIKVPQELGVMGFQNEPFDELLIPSLSSIEQNSKELGKHAADIYFNILASAKTPSVPSTEVIQCALEERDSTRKNVVSATAESAVSM
ncbi:MAG: LacI family transcriptional regulator [Segetibacter sp.]|nr:LacI family transcriptional regulator [Segetibacter sp.]